MGSIQKDTKETNRSVSYEDISTDIEENINFSYNIDDYELDYKDVIIKITVELEKFIETEPLTETEKKLGFALIEIFSNFEEIFQIGDGNKFNKNLILLSLREMTSLTTKEIRMSMKKYRKIYEGIMKNFIEI